MDFMSAPSQECGVLSSLLFLWAEGDMGRTGIWGAGTAALGCRKMRGGVKQIGTQQVPSGTACAEPNQESLNRCLNNTRCAQKGETLNQRGVQKGRDANSPCLNAGSWCSRDCPMHLEQHAGPEGMSRSWSTPRMIGGWLCGLSGPLILPCHPCRDGLYPWGRDRMQWGCPCAMAQSLSCAPSPHSFPLGTQTDPGWKHFVILYILEDLSFNNFVLSMVLFISIHDLWISNEHALQSRNLHGNSYKSGGKCTLCLQLKFLDQKLPSSINLYNCSKKNITMTDKFCFKLDYKAQK